MQIDKLITALEKAKRLADVKKAERALMHALGHMTTPVIRGAEAYFIVESLASHVSVVGDWNGWDPSIDKMKRLNLHAHVWLLKRTFAFESRFAYRFVMDGKESHNDPLNPAVEREVFGANTTLRMPGYHDDPYIKLHEFEIPQGRMREFIVPNGYRNQEFSRPVRIYTPNTLKRYAGAHILYVHDGAEVITVGRVPTILDNLYHFEPHTPHCVVVMVPPMERNKEYMLNAQYSNWIAQTLVPFVEKKLGVKATPQKRGTLGASLGGLLSAQLGLIHPRIFGNIAVQSPSFWYQKEEMIRHYEKMRKLPLRWYMHTGTVNDAEVESRKMLAVLQDKGYDVTYRETIESHNWGNWRNKYSDIVRWLVSKD